MLDRPIDEHDIHDLTRLCLSGDQIAVRELVDRFRDRVFGVCRRMLVHHQDAEDAAQETFVRALRYLKSWDTQRNFERWLLAIAGNRCRSALAKRQAWRPQGLEHEPLDRTTINGSAHQLEEEIGLALNGLRAEYRECFLLFHRHHQSYEQIAATVGHPVGTIKTWVHRARRELMDTLNNRGVLERTSPIEPSPASRKGLS